MRQPNDSIGEYVAHLLEREQDCRYGTTLTHMLRDRLVCGINDETLQRRLLAEINLTFEKEFKIVLVMESTYKITLDFQGKASSCNSIKRENRKKRNVIQTN